MKDLEIIEKALDEVAKEYASYAKGHLIAEAFTKLANAIAEMQEDLIQ